MVKCAWSKYTDMVGQDSEAPGDVANCLNFTNEEILLFLHKLKIL